MIMKATPKGLLRRALGRKQETPAVARYFGDLHLAPEAPASQQSRPMLVITGEVPVRELSLTERDDYLMLMVAINRGDYLGIPANTRAAAIRGMESLATSDPARMEEILTEVGSMGREPLTRATRELAGYGRAR